MTRFALAILLASAAFIPAAHASSPVALAPSCPASAALFARASTNIAAAFAADAPGTLTWETRVDGLICGQVAAGTYALHDVEYLLVAPTPALAEMNLASASFTLAPQADVTFAANAGMTGAATANGYADTGYTPSSGQMTTSSSTMGVCILNARTTLAPNSYASQVGTQGASGNNDVLDILTGGNSSVSSLFVDGSSAGIFSQTSIPSTQGGFWASRSADAAHVSMYANGVLVGTQASTQQTVSGFPSFHVFGIDNGGTPVGTVADTIGAVVLGAGETQAQILADNALLTAALNGMGVSGCDGLPGPGVVGSAPPPLPPANITQTEIAGLDYPNNGTTVAATGTTLTLRANDGQWSNATSFAHNWHTVNAPTVSLGTGPTLAIDISASPALVGQAIELDVTATNAGGSGTVTSHWFGPIEASAPVAPVAYETQNPAPTSIPLPVSPAHFLQCYGPGTFQHAVFPGGAIPPCAPNLTPSNVFYFDPINGQTEAAMIAASVPTASLGHAGHAFKDLNAFFDDQSVAGYSGALFGRLIPAGALVYVEPGDATHPVESIVSGNPHYSTSDGTATGTPVFTWVMADPAAASLPVIVNDAGNHGAIFLANGDDGFIIKNLSVEPAIADVLLPAISISSSTNMFFEGLRVSGWISHSADPWPGSYPTTGGQSNGDVTTATPAIPAGGLQDGEVVVVTMAQGATTFSGASTALVGRYLWSHGYYRDSTDFISGGSSGIPNGTKILSVDGTGVATIGPCDPVADAATGCPSTPIPGCDPLVNFRGTVFGGCPAGTRPAWSGATRAISGERLQTTEQMRVLPTGYWSNNDWGTGFNAGFVAGGGATAGANPAAPNVFVGTNHISVKDSWFRDVGNAIQFASTTNSIVYNSGGNEMSRDFLDNYSNHRLWVIHNKARNPTQIWDHQDAIQHGDSSGTGHQILYGNADIENEFIQQTDPTNPFPRSWQGINTTDNTWWQTYVANNIVYANTNGISVGGQYNVVVHNDMFGGGLTVGFQHKTPDGLPIHSLMANNAANGVGRDFVNATACSPTTGDLDTVETNISIPFVPLGGPGNSNVYCAIGSVGAASSGTIPGVYVGLSSWTQADWRTAQAGVSPLFSQYAPLAPPVAPAPGAGLWFNTSTFTAIDLRPNPAFAGTTNTIIANVSGMGSPIPQTGTIGDSYVLTRWAECFGGQASWCGPAGTWWVPGLLVRVANSTTDASLNWQHTVDGSGNFVLPPYTPGIIGAGTALGAQQPIADHDGKAWNSPPSIGAYESH